MAMAKHGLIALRWSIVAAFSLCVMTQAGALERSPELPRLKAPGKQLPSGSTPNRLHLYIGGFLGAAYWVDLQGDTLTHRVRRYDSEAKGMRETVKEHIRPSAAQRSQFWKALEEARLWQWRPHYPPPPNLADGTQWSVDMEWAGRRIRSTGDKNFPGGSSVPPGSGLFEKYLAGVRALLSGEHFE
jgi:hypothetical protein